MDSVALHETLCHIKKPQKKPWLLYMGTHHWLHTKDSISASSYVSKYHRIARTGKLTPESLTCALDRSETTTLYHTLRANGSRKLEEGSPKRMNRGI